MEKLFENEKQFTESEYLFRIVKNNVNDELYVIFSDGSYFVINDSPFERNGGSWFDRIDINHICDGIETGEYTDLKWYDLSGSIRINIIKDINFDYSVSYSDFECPDFGYKEDVNIHHYGTYMSAGEGIFVHGVCYFINTEEGIQGPYKTYTEAYRCSLPDHYSLAGPEYHSPLNLFDN